MNKTYEHITNILLNDKRTSLQFWMSSSNRGIKNQRTVYIEEPNPYEGEVANPCSGLDQQVFHENRWARRGFKFKGRDTLEALKLLDEKAKGEEPKQIISEGMPYRDREKAVHGYETAQGGLDNWLFTDYKIAIIPEEEHFAITLKIGEFHNRDRIVSSLPIQDVDEGIQIYENNPIRINTLQALYQGVILSDKIKRKTSWKEQETLLANTAGHTVQQKFIKTYHDELKKLEAFNISGEIKDGLFMGLLANSIYQQR